MDNSSYFLSDVLFLGNRLSLEGSTRLSVRFYLALKDLLQHVFICGDVTIDKTILGKVMIEELAIKKIPTIVIDLKGDLSSMGLLFGRDSSGFLGLWSDECEGQGGQEVTSQTLQYHIKQLKNSGSKEDFIDDLKRLSEVVIFTPHGEKGIPLAMSSFIDAPENIQELYSAKREDVVSMARSLVHSLIQRLYFDINLEEVSKESALLIELVIYAWLNNIKLEGPRGLRRLAELVDEPPLENIRGSNLEEFIPLQRRNELARRLLGFISTEEKIWYRGVPLDIDLICDTSRKMGKSFIVIINLAELQSFGDRCFVISRVAYSIYAWMQKHKGVQNPSLAFYIDDIGTAEKSFYPRNPFYTAAKPAIDLLLKEGGAYGVGCIIASQNYEDMNYQGLNSCKTWILGKFASQKDRAIILEGISSHNIVFDRIDTLIHVLDSGEFLVRMCSGEAALIKERWIASLHYIVPSSFLLKIISAEIRENFRLFYVAGTQSSGAEVSLRAKSVVVIPEVIFEEFNFGYGHSESFVLGLEPEAAISLCLKELAKESILPDEIQFGNVQLMVARAHRGDWKVDALIRSPVGTVLSRIKERGVYVRFDTPVELKDDVRDKLTELVEKPVTTRSSEIARKVVVRLPDSNKISQFEVKDKISKQLDVTSRDVSVSIKEQNVAVGWKFVLVYRKRFIECYLDIINRSIQIDYPVFSVGEALEEIRKLYPAFDINEKRVWSASFLYKVSYSTEDNTYMWDVSRRSGKILEEKISITEKKARQIAKNNIDEEPFGVWKEAENWDFSYSTGDKLIVDEESGKVTRKKVVSPHEVERLVEDVVVNETRESGFSTIKKEFKEGKWLYNVVSEKWDINLEIYENGIVTRDVKLQRDYCLEEARKILTENGVPSSMQKSVNIWKKGWEFNFLSSLGEFTIRIDQREKDFIKQGLTREGIKHFVQLETGGRVINIKDRISFWEVFLKKNGRIYQAEVNKQDGAIVKLKKSFLLLFSKEVSLSDIKNAVDAKNTRQKPKAEKKTP